MQVLTNEQKSFIESEGMIIVKACPGSGKTYSVANKVLSYMEKWPYSHQGVAVLSFTNVASDEICNVASNLKNSPGKLSYPHFIGTVDSFINEYIVLRYGYLITHDRGKPIIALNDRWGIPYQYWRKDCHKQGCVNSAEDFRWGIDNQFYRGNKLVTCKPTGNAKALPCQQYKSMLLRRNIIFQNEVAAVAFRLLKDHPKVAHAIAKRFPVIIIDEAQDTSDDQMAVFDLLIDSGVKSCFLVGDPDQAIYEWRDANPDGFMRKYKSDQWRRIDLTDNFRSSQKICDATSFFSATLQGRKQIRSHSKYKDENQKPVLLLVGNKTEAEVIDFFLNKCQSMGIDLSAETVAVLSRGRIHSDTEIKGLWKSKEVEMVAKAAYEWNCGSRNRAYIGISKMSYRILIGEETDDYEMNLRIREYADERIWKAFVIEVLRDIPSVELGLGDWINQFSKCYSSLLGKYGFRVSDGKDLQEIIKIKTRDKNTPAFKEIPLRSYFEKKQFGEYTRSSIHGVKGESYDAVLLYINSIKGKTLTPSFLTNGSLDDELMRIAYVGMTRPRRLLMVSMPIKNKEKEEYKRFDREKWEYIYL